MTLAETTTLGLGVRATPETLDVRLLSATGEPLGSGPVQMHRRLPPGDYVLRVSLAPDLDPVRYAPVLLGRETPDELIPDAVIERFLPYKDES